MKKLLLLVIVGAVLGFAYYTLSPYWRNIAKDEASPLSAVTSEEVVAVPEADGVLAKADLVAMAHEVEGSVQLIRVGQEHTLRFEDLDTINGPDLRIYLATDTSADEFIDLGKIKATEGNVNYPLPAAVDLAKYDTVLIWCKAFGVLFSYAELAT